MCFMHIALIGALGPVGLNLCESCQLDLIDMQSQASDEPPYDVY